VRGRDGRIIARRRDAGAQFDAGLVDALQAALLEAPAPNGASDR
jgi:hypothetical protein